MYDTPATRQCSYTLKTRRICLRDGMPYVPKTRQLLYDSCNTPQHGSYVYDSCISFYLRHFPPSCLSLDSYPSTSKLELSSHPSHPTINIRYTQFNPIFWAFGSSPHAPVPRRPSKIYGASSLLDCGAVGEIRGIGGRSDYRERWSVQYSLPTFSVEGSGRH